MLYLCSNGGQNSKNDPSVPYPCVGGICEYDEISFLWLYDII